MDIDTIASELKRCTRCGEEKSAVEFSRRPSAPTGLRSWCKACDKASRPAADPDVEYYRFLPSRYGLSGEDYDRLVAAQSGKCAICGCDPRVKYAAKHISTRRLHVDHDHDTGRVRGLLCVLCNRVLGQCEEDADRMRAAAAYIEREGTFVDVTKSSVWRGGVAEDTHPHACLSGYVFLTYTAFDEEVGDEVEVIEAVRCRRCANSR